VQAMRRNIRRVSLSTRGKIVLRMPGLLLHYLRTADQHNQKGRAIPEWTARPKCLYWRRAEGRRNFATNTMRPDKDCAGNEGTGTRLLQAGRNKSERRFEIFLPETLT